MSAGLWSQQNYPSTATQATCAQAAPVAGDALQVRGRVFTFSVSGSSSAATGLLQCVVRDGATGTGTIIWSGSLQAPANGSSNLILKSDLRASVGNALTAEFTGAGATGTQEAVSMQGDIVPSGYPPFGLKNLAT